MQGLGWTGASWLGCPLQCSLGKSQRCWLVLWASISSSGGPATTTLCSCRHGRVSMPFCVLACLHGSSAKALTIPKVQPEGDQQACLTCKPASLCQQAPARTLIPWMWRYTCLHTLQGIVLDGGCSFPCIGLQNQGRTVFRHDLSMPLEPLLTTYCKWRGLDLKRASFLWLQFYMRLGLHDTGIAQGLDDGDHIHVFDKQVGEQELLWLSQGPPCMACQLNAGHLVGFERSHGPTCCSCCAGAALSACDGEHVWVLS